MMALPAFGTLLGEAVRAGLVAGGFLVLLILAEIWQRAFRPPAEWTRKFVHVAGGVAAGVFPVLFAHHWTVLVLGLVSFAMLALGKRLGWIGSVTGVERRSVGELYFPISVYLLFLVASDRPIFYVISLWMLVFADTAAALLGSAYGRHTYTVEEDRRSFEGSAAFLLVSFLGAHVPLLLGTDVDRAASLLIAAQLALLIASFEAISMRGNDNLIIPLATYYLLLKLTPQPWQGIAVQILVQLTLLGGMLLLARRVRFLTWAGAVAAHLTLYAAFSLGGPVWTMAPLLALAGLIGYLAAAPVEDAGTTVELHEVREVFYVSIVSVAMLFLDNGFATWGGPGHPLAAGHPFFVPFVGSLAATLGIVGYRALRRRFRLHTFASAVVAVVTGWAVVTPISLALGPTGLDAWPLVASAAICILSLALYLTGRGWLRTRAASVQDLRLQAVCVLIATVLTFVFAMGASARG